ncbi:damage inducible protein CinA [Clostridiaceae bacterium JG1575]|nr:damage inducible protein CinA [Clostridiaceae bacterium JG1575]
MVCEIICVGTELLLGDIVNTNAQYLARELAAMGIQVFRQTTVGDNPQRLHRAFSDAFLNADLVITTGGLGPTLDDLTKETAASFFGQELIVHKESLERLEAYFGAGSEALKGGNEKQALFPKEAVILKNPNGTAPGAVLIDGSRRIAVLPGPPREMIPMFQKELKLYLETLQREVLVSKILRFTGLGEWDMAQRVADLSLGENPTVAPYAKDGECILRLTARGESPEACEALLTPAAEEIRRRLADFYYGEGEETLKEKLARLLIERNISCATAESLTGGLLASSLIDSDLGISKVFREGYITYSNDAKIRDLGVQEATLLTHGAVSEETARQMVQGLYAKSSAQLCLATTGIAGPTGATPEKPLGLTYLALCYRGEVSVARHVYRGGRQSVRRRAVQGALALALRALERDGEGDARP